MPHWTALVTLLAVAAYFYVGFLVGRARGRYQVKAPATTGDPAFERAFRAQQNMLEWMPMFLPLLWICALYTGDRWSAAVGAAWIVARLVYTHAYMAEASKRGVGFVLQMTCTIVLFIGATVGVTRALMG